jgi:hypothetical protein
MKDRFRKALGFLGLIEDEYIIRFGKDSSQSDALLLTTRQVIGVGVGGVEHTQAVQRGVDLPTSAQSVANSARR